MTEVFPAFDARDHAQTLAEFETECARADLAGSALVHMGLALALAGYAIAASLTAPQVRAMTGVNAAGTITPGCPAPVVPADAFNDFARRLLERRAYQN